MDPPQHAPEDQQVVQVVELRGVSPLTRVKGKMETLVAEDALTLGVAPWRHHRQLLPGQFEAEAVLFPDLVGAPASRAVELGDQRLGIRDADLIDAVLVAVEGEGAAIAVKTLAFNRVHDEIRGQGMEWMSRDGH